MYRTQHGMRANVDRTLDQTLELVREALVDQGLVVLNLTYFPAERAVRSDWPGRRLALLTACHPSTTAEAISHRQDAASLLFCRIGVHEAGEANCAVSVIDPKKAIARYTKDDELIRLAARTRDRLIIALLLLERDTLLEAC